jgi:4-hydroxy-2-oxoglutarate aldolase
VLVVSPHYYTSSMTRDALRAHFIRVADASPLPVVLYNIPKYAHFALALDLIVELAEHPNIVGMKDSAGDLAMLERYIGVQSATFTVLTGNGPTFAAALGLGAKGGILAAALFAPELAREVYTAAARGDSEGARRAQERLTPSAREVVGDLGVPGVKAALDAIGLHGGIVRAPLQPLGDDGHARVASLMRSISGASV